MGGRCIAQNISGAKRQQQLKFLSFNYDIDINSNSTENELFDKLHAYLLKCVHASGYDKHKVVETAFAPC